MRLFAIRNVGTVGLLFALLVGCADRSTPQLAIDEGIDGKDDASSPESIMPVLSSPMALAEIDPAAINAKGQPKETWEAVFAYGTKIGWGHAVTTNFEENGRKLVRVDNKNHVSVDRKDQPTTITISTHSIETPEGELLRFHTEMEAGPSRTVTQGRVQDGQLLIETTTQGKTTREVIPWPPGTLGFNATEQSLANSPLLPGGRRTLKAVMPVTNEIVTIELAADEYEPAALLDHTEDLLRVESTLTLPVHVPDEKPSVIRSRMWTNREGQVLKTAIAALHQETFRTSREQAVSASGPRRFDLVIDNNVPIDRSLPHPYETRRIRYRVRLDGDDPAKVFFSGRLQQINPLDSHTAEITVWRCEVEPLRTLPASSGDRADGDSADIASSSPSDLAKVRRPPTDADRQPNNLIQSDDAHVVEMAQSVAPEETDCWKLALALETFVKKTIQQKNFSQAFSTAAEVARMREGDCTEHAVLLAALARARGIPARVAIGLVYQPDAQGFAYHMWNELWIADRWVPLDATLGHGGCGAAHLKLADSNLAGAQAYSCFLPVAQVIGQLKIEVLEVE